MRRRVSRGVIDTAAPPPWSLSLPLRQAKQTNNNRPNNAEVIDIPDEVEHKPPLQDCVHGVCLRTLHPAASVQYRYLSLWGSPAAQYSDSGGGCCLGYGKWGWVKLMCDYLFVTLLSLSPLNAGEQPNWVLLITQTRMRRCPVFTRYPKIWYDQRPYKSGDEPL